MLLFDVRRQSCCSGVSSLQMTYDMQAGQAVTAGYFGGYSAKMQDVGGKELELMQQALERKAGAHTDKSVHKQVCVF